MVKICVVLDRTILLNAGMLGKILLYVGTNKGNMVKLKGDNSKVTILNIRLECVPSDNQQYYWVYVKTAGYIKSILYHNIIIYRGQYFKKSIADMQ